MTTGAEHWEILSDSERDIFEHIADLHDAARDVDIDEMALEYEPLPPPSPVPWGSLGAAFADAEYTRLMTVERYEVRVTGSDLPTIRPVARAS